MTRVTRNAVKCLKCMEIIESKNRHDFKFCGCGNIAVDGGLDYMRLVGKGLDDGSWEDLAEYDES